MNLQPVAIATSGPLIFRCCCCKEIASQRNEIVFADLDGEPFEDYYCETCAHEYK